MDTSDIDQLYLYNYPFNNSCDGCNTPDITIFYKTPDEDHLCNSCGSEVINSVENIDIKAIDRMEHSSDEPQGLKSDSDTEVEETSSEHIRDMLIKVTPGQQYPNRDRSFIEYEYDRINWEAVNESDKLQDGQISGSRYPGAYDEIQTSGFLAISAYLDSTLTEHNTVYITDEGVYVYDFVYDQVPERTLQSEVLRVLSEFAQEGTIKGLRPCEDVPPPNLHEKLSEFHDNIRDFVIEEQEDLLICRVVVDQIESRAKLNSKIRTSSGITYPKPDRIDVITD